MRQIQYSLILFFIALSISIWYTIPFKVIYNQFNSYHNHILYDNNEINLVDKNKNYIIVNEHKQSNKTQQQRGKFYIQNAKFIPLQFHSEKESEASDPPPNDYLRLP